MAKLKKTYSFTAQDDVTDWIDAAGGESQIVSFQGVDGGAWNGTLTFEQTVDGTNAVPALAVPVNSTTGSSTATAANIYTMDGSGGRRCRVRVSAYTGGTLAVTVGVG